LVFAVLAERVRWQTAFKLAVFMPMAISFLAAGVIFRLVYDADPDKGLANAVLTTIDGAFHSGGEYVGARAIDADGFRTDMPLTTTAKYNGGDTVNFGFVGIPPATLPSDAKPVATSQTTDFRADRLRGSVWLDFVVGGGGRSGVPDENEKGMPGVTVNVLDSSGKKVASDTADASGHWEVTGLKSGGPYALRVNDSAFKAPWGGVDWLGKRLVTASVIAAFVWIWAGFAMIVIGSGLAAIPRDVLEAARVDGANEWQVFRRVTVPLLAPVLVVVLVTLVINVLKVFDLVFIIPPGSVQDDATVIALEMWRVSFGGSQDQGLGSAISVVLFLLVIPAMVINIKRFRSGN
jgi:alpha-glucoside transport system permease protein